MARFPYRQWLRPPGLRSIRLATGLVMFTYVGTHLANRALGNVSLAWMERDLLVQKFVWQGWLGTTVLYGALVTHFFLGLWALYERRSVHWTPAELAQLVLGLCIPPLLANHLANTRIAFAEFGLNKGYAQLLYAFWNDSPFFGRVQLTLLVVAWLHGGDAARLPPARSGAGGAADAAGVASFVEQIAVNAQRRRHAGSHIVSLRVDTLAAAAHRVVRRPQCPRCA
ncbi:hypothetical protein OIV52_31225, partial [Burkholderia pseudomallei]|nr:hypothetical protein [Burkholderia pseudomallei]